jgi:hypothetical protein
MHLSHLWTPLLTTLAVASTSLAQVDFGSTHNVTKITGTWSSGSMAVRTGAGFAHPANTSFTYPRTTGISYSFSDDGFYEVARYRFKGNGSEPTCIVGIISWVHGKYSLLANGSIVLVPMGDGYQQIQDPCAAQSNFIEFYNHTELYQSWSIFEDTDTSNYQLRLYQFDGAPLAPQTLVSATPNMLPTQLLRNVPPVLTSQDGYIQGLLEFNSESNSIPTIASSFVVAIGALALTMASLVL